MVIDSGGADRAWVWVLFLKRFSVKCPKSLCCLLFPPSSALFHLQSAVMGGFEYKCGSLTVLGSFAFVGWGQDSFSSALLLLCVSLHGVFHGDAQKRTNFQISDLLPQFASH